MLGAGEELGIGQADLVHNEPTPKRHGLEGGFCGSPVTGYTAQGEAKGFVDGLALEVCCIRGLEGHDLIVT